MGYAKESRQPLVQPETTWQNPITITATGDKALCRVMGPCEAVRIGFLVTTALTTTAAVVDFDKRVTPGSDTGRVDQGVGRVTAPAAAQAVGKMIHKEVNSVKLVPGEEVVFEVVTAPAEGAVIPYMEVIPIPEEPVNLANMVKSA